VPELSGLLRLTDANGHPLNGMLSRAYLIQALKWFGSESGRAKLLKAFGESPGSEDIHSKLLRLAGTYLTKEQVDAINDEHLHFDTVLFPHMDAYHQTKYGLPLERVKAMGYEITFADGTTVKYAGGYYPMHWDRRPGVEVTARQVQMEGGGSMYPTVGEGSFEDRTKYVGVPDLNWNNVPGHLLTNVHAIAYGQFVQQANRVLLNPRMTAMLARHHGEEFAKWPRAWLETVATGSAGRLSSHLSDVSNGMRVMRSNTISALIGYNIPTLLAHMPHGVAALSMKYGPIMGLRYGIPAMKDVLNSTASAMQTGEHPLWDIHSTESMVLKLRHDSLREDMERFYNGMILDGTASEGGQWSAAGTAEKFGRWYRGGGFWHLREADRIMSMTIYEASKRKEMEDGKTPEEAQKIAEDLVMASMPTYNPMELPSILRDKHGSIASMMLVFHTFWSKYREMYDEGKLDQVTNPALVAKFKGEPSNMLGPQNAVNVAQFAGRTLAMLTMGVVLGELMKGQGKTASEDWSHWLLKAEIEAPLKMIPYAYQVVGPLIDHNLGNTKKMKRPEITNVFFAPIFRAVKMIDDLGDPSAQPLDKVLNTTDGLLLMGGYPSIAPVRAAKAGIDMLTGEDPASGLIDAAGRMIYGKKKGRGTRYETENPATVMQSWVDAVSNR
jgi:hypothetical protein